MSLFPEKAKATPPSRFTEALQQPRGIPSVNTEDEYCDNWKCKAHMPCGVGVCLRMANWVNDRAYFCDACYEARGYRAKWGDPPRRVG